jgi:hypothetical protein
MESDYQYIAKVCAESPYSLRELDRIMFCEAWPALIANLYSMAGEWSGWNEEFLVNRILSKYRLRLHIWWRLNPLKLFYCWKWGHVKSLVKRHRANAL